MACLGFACLGAIAPSMCGRFTQHRSWEELQRLADLIVQLRERRQR